MKRYNVQLTEGQMEFIERSLEMLWIEAEGYSAQKKQTLALIKKFEKAMEG